MIPGVSQRACRSEEKQGIRTACNVVPGKCDPVTGKLLHNSRRVCPRRPFKYAAVAIVPANRWTKVDFPTLAHPTIKISFPPKLCNIRSANSIIPLPVMEEMRK